MSEWFESLSGYGRVLFVIAIAASVLLIIQLVFLMIGVFNGDTEFDGNVDVDDLDGINDDSFFDIFGLKLITFRGIVAFFGVGCWTALIILEASKSALWGTLGGVAAGVAAMFLVAYIMKKIYELQQEGNVIMKNAIGKEGIVYLTIHKNRSSIGKVNVLVQERLCEYDAVTDEDTDILTGEKVEIIGLINDILEVKRK